MLAGCRQGSKGSNTSIQQHLAIFTKEEKFMKKMRKGFTLVELLIVIAILGTLSAAMSTSVTGATAKAKAATIASNVEACISAARLYAANNAGDGLADLTADEVLFASFPKWKDFGEGTIKYKSVTTGKGVDGWAITVEFDTDPDKDGIRDALLTMKGYVNSYTQTVSDGTYTYTSAAILGEASSKAYKFQVTLTSGKITAYSGS